MNTQNTISARVLYENALKLIVQAGLDPAKVKLTQSDIILEQQLNVTTSKYTFPVLVTDNGPSGTSRFNTEIRLNQQDSLIVGAWGWFLLEPTSATATNAIAHTYPNPVVFATANEAAALETLYNSYAQIVVNNDVTFPVWSLSRNRVVPQSQQQTGAANAPAIANTQIDLSSDGFFPVEPNLVLIGSKNTVITVNLPSAIAVINASGFTRLRCHFRGLLAQNSTIIT